MFVTGHAVINLLYFKLSPVALIENPFAGVNERQGSGRWGRRGTAHHVAISCSFEFFLSVLLKYSLGLRLSAFLNCRH